VKSKLYTAGDVSHCKHGKFIPRFHTCHGAAYYSLAHQSPNLAYSIFFKIILKCLHGTRSTRWRHGHIL